MKKIIYGLLVASVALLTGCNDDFLERPQFDQITDENFWQDEAHLKSVANTFTTCMQGAYWLNITEIMADHAPWAVTTAFRTIGGGNYATNIGNLNSIWVRAYEGIGRANYFLANYQRAVNVKPEIRERYAAEAYFYRAYNYWILTNYFGDVPYITEVLNVESPDVYRGRDKRSVVVDGITKDLEAHYKALPEYIPAASEEFGHISQAAALVLLSRIYLFNGRYADAVDACERAMENPYHELYTTGKPDEDYYNLFTYTGRASRIAANKETILAYVYNYNLGEDARTSHNTSRANWVPGDYARFVPTKKAIELYLTADGQIWDPKQCNSYEEVFQNRDPRMCQTILAPGTPWTGGPDGDITSTDKSIYRYPLLINDKTGAMTYTGYYMRKYVEPSTVKYVSHDDNDIVMMRYAEVLLNYAEAKELDGKLTQADLDKSINLLRKRVGMVPMELGKLPAGSDIRTEIRRERSVELFYEGHRYFDIIRWRIGETLGEDLVGVNRRWLDQSRLKVNLSQLQWVTIDGEQYLLLETNRTFDPNKHYLLSIPFKQMQLNPNLAPNNPGW